MRRLLLETQATSTISPSATNPNYNTNNHNSANFDTNMVIILAALLSALICGLGLNSILHCVIRCIRRLRHEDSVTSDANMVMESAKGIKKQRLKQISVDIYSSKLHMKETECLICLGEFLEGEKVRVLPKCSHGFHVRCVDTWLLSHSSCPTCRQSLLEHQTTSYRPDDGVRQDADVAVVASTAS